MFSDHKPLYLLFRNEGETYFLNSTLQLGYNDYVWYRLKEAGYGIYLLSNASVDQPNYWKKLPVSRHFDGTLVSAFVKQVKPMHEIYRTFTRKFDLKPEECVFIDDVPMNVACAILNGWEGIVFYGDARELQVKLAALGVRI